MQHSMKTEAIVVSGERMVKAMSQGLVAFVSLTPLNQRVVLHCYCLLDILPIDCAGWFLGDFFIETQGVMGSTI